MQAMMLQDCFLIQGKINRGIPPYKKTNCNKKNLVAKPVLRKTFGHLDLR